jgi:hypothetical protein
MIKDAVSNMRSTIETRLTEMEESKAVKELEASITAAVKEMEN